MKLANIIYEKDLINHTKVDYINYYNEPIEYNKLDKNIPTLYVGWSFMKDCNPNYSIIQNADILKKIIINNELYWECSFEEGKASHIKGIETFVNYVPQFYFTPKFLYHNIDPIFLQIKNIQDLMNVIPMNIKTCYIYKNEMIYLLSDNNIFGINLNIFQYFQFNIEEIITQLSIRTETLHVDTEGINYQSYYKLFPNFALLKRYVVVMLTK